MADAGDFVKTEAVVCIVAIVAAQTKRCGHFALCHHSNHRHTKFTMKAAPRIVRLRSRGTLIQALNVPWIAR